MAANELRTSHKEGFCSLRDVTNGEFLKGSGFLTFEAYFAFKAATMGLMVVFLHAITGLIHKRASDAQQEQDQIRTEIFALSKQEQAYTKQGKRKLKWLRKDLETAKSEYKIMRRRYLAMDVASILLFVIFDAVLLITRPFGGSRDILAICLVGSLSILAQAITKGDRSPVDICLLAILGLIPLIFFFFCCL